MNIRDNYKNKYFSILGDSVSTLDGYSEPDFAAFYEGINKFKADVFSSDDTWWGQVITRLGGELLVNNSFSGSMVHKHRLCEIPSYGCSDERTAALSRAQQTPDVVMIFMGINDWGCGAKLTPVEKSEQNDISYFSVAYRKMLEKLKKNYPEAELWCFTLPVSTCKDDETFAFPYCHGGRHIEKYCEWIRTCAKEYGCRVIDLYCSEIPYDTIDGFHPNKEGMKTLADSVLQQL